jgi:hypothetical protein
MIFRLLPGRPLTPPEDRRIMRHLAGEVMV